MRAEPQVDAGWTHAKGGRAQPARDAALLYREPVTDASWPVLAAGLAGTVLGSVLQWVQGALQARRDRKRQEQGWSREDQRLWTDHRQTLYLDTLSIARRWTLSLETGYGSPGALGRDPSAAVKPNEPWQRQPDLVTEWNKRLAEVEFYGSEEVRSSVAKLDRTFEMLETFNLPDNAVSLITRFVGDTYAECVSFMRRDLGLSDAGPFDLNSARRVATDFMRAALGVPPQRPPSSASARGR